MDRLPPKSRLEKTRDWMASWKAGQRVESAYPWVLAAVAAGAAWFIPLDDAERRSVIDGVIEPAISVASILAGFQATALTVLLSVMGSEAVKFLKKAGKYELLVSYVIHSFVSLVLFVVVAFVVLSAEKAGNAAVLGRTSYTALTALFTFSLFSSYRISMLMIRLLKSKHANI